MKFSDYGNYLRTLADALDHPDVKIKLISLKAISNCLELTKELESVTDENPILKRLDELNFGAFMDKVQSEGGDEKLLEMVQNIISMYYMPNDDF